MIIKKIFIGVLLLITMNGCVQSTALLGPALTIGTSGNIIQAGIQYGTNQVIKKETGKDALTYITDVVEEDHNKKKFNEDFTKILEERIKKTRKILQIPNQ